MIIFLYGEDTYRSTQKLNEIKAKFQKEVDSTGLNQISLDGAVLKFEEFNQHIKASPFLARKRMIIIKNLISSNKSKEIQKEIVKLLDNEMIDAKDDNIIVFWEEADHSKSKSKNALWDRLVKEKLAQEFKPLTPTQLNQWLNKEAKTRQLNFEKEALPLLAAKVGNDLWQMVNELDKLANFKKDQLIRPADIESLVKAKFDDDIFKLIDALGNNNKKQALKLIADQLDSGANEIYLLTMLSRQFRTLLLTKDIQAVNPQISKAQLSQELQIHPFVAQKALWQTKNFTLNQLKIIYQLLLDIDFKIKTSSLKPKLLFDLFIAQI
jgi:DNA polymerase-3 subunit delta